MLTPEEFFLHSSFDARTNERPNERNNGRTNDRTIEPTNKTLPKPLRSHCQSIRQHLPQRPQRPSYYVAAAPRSTTLQKLCKSQKNTKNIKKKSNSSLLVEHFGPIFSATVMVINKKHDYSSRKNTSSSYPIRRNALSKSCKITKITQIHHHL